jgi:hypothetical protein
MSVRVTTQNLSKISSIGDHGFKLRTKLSRLILFGRRSNMKVCLFHSLNNIEIKLKIRVKNVLKYTYLSRFGPTLRKRSFRNILVRQKMRNRGCPNR